MRRYKLNIRQNTKSSDAVQFLIGMGTVLDLSSVKPNITRRAVHITRISDQAALKSDWIILGKDFQKSIEHFEKEVIKK